MDIQYDPKTGQINIGKLLLTPQGLVEPNGLVNFATETFEVDFTGKSYESSSCSYGLQIVETYDYGNLGHFQSIFHLQQAILNNKPLPFPTITKIKIFRPLSEKNLIIEPEPIVETKSWLKKVLTSFSLKSRPLLHKGNQRMKAQK